MYATRWLGLLVSVFVLASTVNAQQSILSTEDVARGLTSYAIDNRFPRRINFQSEQLGKSISGQVRYTFDPQIHQTLADVYLRFQPDYACFVVIDPQSGAILNLSSFIKGDEQLDNLALRSEYPAASVFKIITASAGLDLGKVVPSTVIPYNGKSTSLYKSQVFQHKKTKWTRTPTFKESFAKSINPVFGRFGATTLGADNLMLYAQRFGFEVPLQSDFILAKSQIGLTLDSDWPVAEAASGFTRKITMSPIHAAQIAAIIANDGKMVTPYLVESVHDDNGRSLYQSNTGQQSKQVIQAKTAQQIRSMMQETTRIGSARKSFYRLDKYKVYDGMKIGGKTGSLTGFSPKGKHDWFVGYAEKEGRRIAYASLIINKNKWYVRSSYVARQFLYEYFTEQANAQELARRSQKPLNSPGF